MAVFQKTAQAEEDLIDIWIYSERGRHSGRGIRAVSTKLAQSGFSMRQPFSRKNSPTVEPWFDNLQGVVVCNGREILVVVQQPAMMFECRSSNDAVVGLADGSALFAQLAINVSRPDKDSGPFAGERFIAARV